jgi:hypothetical protein
MSWLQVVFRFCAFGSPFSECKFGNYVSEKVIIRWTSQQGEGTHSTSCSRFCSSLLVLPLADMSYFRSWNSKIYNYDRVKEL